LLAGDEASCSRSFHPGIGAAGRSHADARGRTPERNVTMVSKEEFDKAAEEVKAITKCTNDEQLELYGWFKQANVGDCNIGSRPAPGAVRARSALRSTPLARSFRPSRARSRVMWRARARFHRHHRIARAALNPRPCRSPRSVHPTLSSYRSVLLSAARPGMFDPKGKAKWDAWDKCKGVSSEEAMKNYVELVESLKAKYA